MAIITKKKILFISHEMSPYHEETEFAAVLNKLAIKSSNEGNEVRVIMPRFGTINERRHKLHEVVRLSGLNINVAKDDYPLIIKVASLPQARLQVYFMENEDFYKRKFIFHDGDGKFYPDNAERMLFFCKGALETVKKFGWPPDVIVVHGWFSGLIPMLIKTHFKNEPVFGNSTIIYTATRNTFKEKLGVNFLKSAMSSATLKDKDLEDFKAASNYSFMAGGAKHADVVITTDANMDSQFAIDVKSNKSRKVIHFNASTDDADIIMELLNKYVEID
jgi:starch synthase